jgi:hypothetical protein
MKRTETPRALSARILDAVHLTAVEGGFLNDTSTEKEITVNPTGDETDSDNTWAPNNGNNNAYRVRLSGVDGQSAMGIIQKARDNQTQDIERNHSADKPVWAQTQQKG